jgi:heptaprenyl diphosphate synthase
MKQFDQFRARRRAIYERFFSARMLCITGLLVMPALLFNPVTFFRILQFFFFWFLAWLSGKKNNPLMTFLIILGIVAFNLVVPYGRVLFSIGPFRVTQGALVAGIHRAVTLEGLIMLSRVSIRRDLKIPGGLGRLIGESFRIFALIVERKQRITRKNFIGDIDRLMIELSVEEPAEAAPEQPAPAQESRPRRFPGLFILAGVLILAWLPWALPLVVFLSRLR